MRLKRRRDVEVPPKIKSFINGVLSTSLENIEEPLKGFVWEFDKGDFHHWVDLLNHFDTFFEKHIKPRKELQLEDNFLESDPPFPKESVLQILRVIRIVLENCTNKHFYGSNENHLFSLLSSADADVVEACLQTLAAFLKKNIGKYVIRDSSLSSKLFAFAQGWGGKEEGLGLLTCATEDGSELVAHELGSTLHYEFYNEKCNDMAAAEESAQGLQVIHLPDVNTCQESHLELLSNLVTTYKVPPSLRFSLFTRLRFAKAFNSLPSRQQFTCIRLYAFTVLVQACGATDDLVSFFNTEPEFINELVSLLCYEDAVPEKIRILSLLSLVALCQDRARQPSVLTAVTSGGHRGILSSLMQKAINSVISNSSKWSVVFAEALVSLVTVLVSSSSGCSAMREAGFIPTLLPLLKDTDPQHLHLVSMAVHVLEAFMDYSNPAAALFRDLGGLDDTIWRLKSEVSYVENITKEKINVSSEVDVLECSNSSLVVASTPSELDNAQPLYSEALVAYYRRLLMKALLRAISLGTYAPGSTTRIYGSEESLLPHCLCSIFKRARDFGGGVFSLAATVMSDLIHKDHTCFSVLEAAGLPSAFLAAIMDGVICSAEAITCIPQCLDALCLNINGLQAVRDHNALRCFVKIFTSRTYLRALSGDTPVTLSNGLDELMRHASSLRGLGVDMLIEILTDVAKIGSGGEVGTTLAESASSSNPVPMETDSEERNWVPSVGKEHSKVEKTEQSSDSGSDASKANFESFLPDCVTNVARLLETVLQSSDICRIFIEKKGIEAVLQLFSLPLMPPTVSIGHNIVVAFKNFSAQHSTSLARAVCSFLREQLVLTNELLVSVEGGLLSQVEASKRMKVLRLLSSLDGILLLLHSSLKGMTTGISELATADADVLKELGRVYRAIVWQISLCSDAKVNEKQNTVQEPESADASVFIAAERESDDDANTTEMRYMNPLSVRNSTHSQWGVGRDFLTVVRSSEGFTRRSRHGLARLRGGRMTGRSWMDTELLANISETFSQDMKKKSPDVLVSETLEKLASALRSFFTSLVKGFTSLNRRRTEPALLNSASKSIASALAKVFSMALRFSGYSDLASNAMPLSVKCRYFGKVVNDMAALTVDSRRHTCYAVMVNNFYAHGTLKEVLTTFEETSELLWRLPCSNSSSADHGKNTEGRKLSHSTWLLDTLQSYCRLLEHFVNSSLLLSLNPGSQAQLLVQPIAVGLSIGLFPIPKEPDAFVRMLQSQVLDVILPVWKHPMFPNCSSGFITTIISIVTYIYSGVGDVKRSPGAVSATNNQRFLAPPPDEANIATIVEMGFTRVRAEEALRRVETNSVEMAMEWLFSHVEDQVQDDDELAEALALSLGSPSEIAKASNDKPTDALIEEGHSKVSPIDDILAAAMNLFQSSDGIRFSVMDLLVTLCNRKKGQDCPKVTTYLVQQLKLCPLEFTKDVSTLSMVSHVLALLLSEDDSTREIAARNGVVSIAIDILMNFKASISSTCEVVASKSISSLLLILDNLLQFKLSIPTDYAEKIPSVPPIDVGNDASLLVSDADADKIIISEVHEKKSETAFEKTFGKSTGYLTLEESHSMLDMSCDLMKQHVPAVVMQAVLQLCARLTKTHSLALRFIENDGIVALFSLSRNCLFPGYDTLASAIVRHLLEDPQTLQAAMELEIRQTFTASRQGSRIPLRSFLTSMAPVISRDPEVFMKAAAAACQLELSGGLTVVVLSKEKEKEKPKASGVEIGASSTECVIVPEAKTHDTPSKCSKGYKKIPANLSQVIDHLIDIVLKYPLPNSEEIAAMEVDEPPALKLKGKSKMEETKKIEPDAQSERLAALAKVTFVLKLLSDILLMYVHAVGVILRRDSEMCQSRGSIHVEGPGHDGIVHHLLHRLLPLCVDGSDGPIEWNTKLSEKASSFLVVLCGRSSEGRKRVTDELVKALYSISNLENKSFVGRLLPDKKVISLADLVYSILSKNSSSGSLPGAGFSPDIAKSMIDGGMVQSLTSILRVLDLDHPDAPKLVDLVLKSLESLTRAANTSEQGSKKSDSVNKKKAVGSNGSPHDQTVTEATEALGLNQNQRNLQVTDGGESQEQHHQGMSQNRDDHEVAPNRFSEQNMRIEVEETMTDNHPIEHQIGFMHEDSEDRGVLHDGNQIEMTFHVDNRADNDMGDEDDDMDDDGDEDEDIAEDGNALMSLADTDGEDDDAGLGDEYNDDVVEDDDDDFPENRVIEVRWREALDGLDHLQVFGQPGARSGIFEVATEPFEGVNVDDLFGLRRSLGFERRRQTNRTSFERSVTEGSHFQHPLLSRPSQSGRDSVSIWSSSENSSRDLEPSAGRFDLGQFYMLDTPALPHDRASSSLFGERLDGGSAAAPTLSDFYFSAGLESLRMSGRRGPGDSRWTDFGQPQASGVASTIADTIEDQFISQLRGVLLVRNSGERLEVPLANNTQIPLTNDTNGGQQTNSQSHNDGVEVAHGEPDQILENVPHEEVNPEVIEVHGSSLSEMQAEDIGGVRGDSMDIEEGDETLHERVVVTDASSGRDSQPRNNALVTSGIDIPNPVDDPDACITRSLDVDMNSVPTEENQIGGDEPPLGENVLDVTRQAEQSGANEASNANAIDPTFLEALPEDLRAEVLAAQQARSAPPPTYEPPSAEDIDPEFLAALPPDIQAEVLAQQRAGRVAQQAEGQPVDMDNASIIATFPADLREEVLLTSSEAVLSALPSSLLAEAQMLRDRAMSHYQARSLFGSSHRINGRRNGLGFDRQTGMDRGGVTIGRRASSSLGEGLKLNEMEGELLLDSHALIALVRLLRLAQPLGKGLLQRLLLNLCAHSVTRATLIWLLLDMIKPETQTAVSKLKTVNAQRLYGCQSNVVYGRSQLLDGLPPLVLRSVLEILTYLATNHSAVANILFHFDSSLIPDFSTLIYPRSNNGKGKEKIVEEGDSSKFAGNSQIGDIPLILLLKLLSRPHFLRSSAQFEQVMGVIQVVVFAAAAKLESQPCSTTNSQNIARNVTVDGIEKEMHVTEGEPDEGVKRAGIESSTSDGKSNISVSDIFLQLPRADLRNVCSLLGHEGLSDKVYLLAGEVLKKLASVATPHRKHFMLELSELANSLSNSAVSELVTLRNTHMLGLSSGSMAGHGVLRVIQILCSLASPVVDGGESDGEMEEHSIMSKLSVALEPLWQELSNCISSTETDLAQSSVSSIMTNTDVQEHAPGSSSSSPPLPPGTQRLLPFIEAFFVLCEKIQAINYVMQNDYADTTAREVKESAGTSAPSPTRVGVDSHKRIDGAVIFAKFAEKHRRLLNAFVRQNPGLLEKSLSVMLKAPRLIDFDNKKAYFRSRIRQHHDQHLSGPLRISVRRAYVLEDSYNQLRMRPTQDMKGRLNVHFQGEEGIDAGGLTREWYQLLSRVIFDKGALLFTTVGNNATFQPNPNSVFQTEHLSYFKFVGRVVAKALFDAQLLDVYFTRSFYKHILGVKVTYHDIEAVDPDYYKNLKWMLENDVSDILDLTFSMDADEEKHILYEKTEVTDYELKPGGRNIRVTEETKHEYVDLVADHILTNAIRPQINSFLEGFNELVPGELISIFNDKELELLISGLPEIDVDDLKANTVYTGYSAASSVIQWFWEVVEAFNKEDMARFLQFVTGTSKVPLEGFKALQGISGPQRFQIHKAYGAPERLPSAHTCFNQLDLPEYPSKEQLQDRLLLAIHEASEGFGFG